MYADSHITTKTHSTLPNKMVSLPASVGNCSHTGRIAAHTQTHTQSDFMKLQLPLVNFGQKILNATLQK